MHLPELRRGCGAGLLVKAGKDQKLGGCQAEGGEGDLCVVCLELLGDGVERSPDVLIGSLAESLYILRELRVERKLAFVGELLDERRHPSLGVGVYEFRHRASLSCMRQLFAG